ncbi:hypothetical protein HY379_01865 [Candidatus Saccharibacteria bacterium]|nr:hypothetical protein [Candidatus Saccharibacteria bacterium]
MPLDPYDRNNLGYLETKQRQDTPVGVPDTSAREVPAAVAAALSAHYSGSPDYRDAIPITDPYAARDKK